MGTGVARALSNTTVRAYAHCHATNASDLTVLLLNLDMTEPSFVMIDMGIAAVEQAGGSPTVEYHLTGKPHQQTVKLNGKALAATAEGVLPPMLGQAGVSTAVQLAPVRPCMHLPLLISVRQFIRCNRPRHVATSDFVRKLRNNNVMVGLNCICRREGCWDRALLMTRPVNTSVI